MLKRIYISLFMFIAADSKFLQADLSAYSSNKQLETAYSQCKDSKLLCAGYPGGCIQNENCQILSSFQRINENGTIQFRLFGDLKQTTNYYISLSLSSKATMDGSVVYCYLDGNGAGQITSGYIKGFDVLSDLNQGIQLNNQVSFNDSVLSCQWLRIAKTFVNGIEYDLLNNKYHILLAKGNMNGDNLTKHDIKPFISDAVDLQSNGTLSQADVPALIKWHGRLMIIGWLGFVSIGITMARHFRDDWPDKGLLGTKIWFTVHRSFMLIGWLLTVVSLILIFVFAKGFIGWYAHPTVGCVCFILSTIQIIGALFRPHPDGKHRWLFNWLHWSCGNTAHILAGVTILLASKTWEDVYLSKSFFWILISLIFWYHLMNNAIKKLSTKTVGTKVIRTPKMFVFTLYVLGIISLVVALCLNIIKTN